MNTPYRPFDDGYISFGIDKCQSVNILKNVMMFDTNPRNEWRGVSDEEYQLMIITARQIQGRIVKDGGMATKSKVEDELMPAFNITRSLAHDITNHISQHNLSPIYPEGKQS